MGIVRRKSRTAATVAPMAWTLVAACAALCCRQALAEPIPQPALVPPQAAGAPEPSGPHPVEAALERRGDLTLRNSSLEGALFTISELWGINIVSSDAPGTVNGVFKNAPLAEILDAILLSNGFSYHAVGDSLVVSKLADLGSLNRLMASATIPIQHATLEEVVAGASMLITPRGKVQPLASANSLFVLDFPDRVEMVREFVATVDAAAQRRATLPISAATRPMEVAYLRTHFIPAATAEKPLSSLLSADGKITAMPDEDRLIVVDYPENLQTVQVVLERIDRPRPQVKIRALIYDISLSDIEQLGLNWGSTAGWERNGSGEKTSFLKAESVTKVPFASTENGGTFTLANLSSSIDINAVALALQSTSDSRLLADPNVTVIENEQASIQSITEVPFQQLTQTTGGGNIGTTAFKEVGIKLDVKPKIAFDGTIEMEIIPEFSRLTGFSPGDNQPIIDKRIANTVVRVANGQTFVLGGLRQRGDVGDFQGIPGLKDIRYLGHLFRSRKSEIRESELVLFISPEIVGYANVASQREQLVEDTIGCRLDRIPQAEGCPMGCGNFTDRPVMLPPSPSGPTLAPPEQIPVDPILHQNPERAPAAKGGDLLRYPMMSSRPQLQRLPAPSGNRPAERLR